MEMWGDHGGTHKAAMCSHHQNGDGDLATWASANNRGSQGGKSLYFTESHLRAKDVTQWGGDLDSDRLLERRSGSPAHAPGFGSVLGSLRELPELPAACDTSDADEACAADVRTPAIMLPHSCPSHDLPFGRCIGLLSAPRASRIRALSLWEPILSASGTAHDVSDRRTAYASLL